VTLFYASSTFGGVWCGFGSNTLTWGSSRPITYPWGSNPAINYTPQSIIEIRHSTEHYSKMVNTHRKHIKCVICQKMLCNEKRLEAHQQSYDPISMNEVLFPNTILPPAGFPLPEPSWFDYSRCTWMAIDKLSINYLLTDNVPGAPPPEVTFNEESIDTQQPDVTCTPDPRKSKTN